MKWPFLRCQICIYYLNFVCKISGWKKILLFLFGISVSRKTTRFSTYFSSRKVCKNFSENINVFIIGFYFHLYHNRNLFCWKILSVLKVFSYHGHFDQHEWVQARPPCTPNPLRWTGDVLGPVSYRWYIVRFCHHLTACLATKYHDWLPNVH